MAMIDLYGSGTERDPVFDGADYGGYSTPGYQPSSGNTGVTGGMDPTNWLAPTTPKPAPTPFSYNAFRDMAEGLGRQYSGSLADFQNSIFPQLQQQFPGIERFGSKGDKIRLPNGEVIDAVISAGLGGRGYNWGVESGGGGGGVSGYFDDPLMQQYLDFGRMAMGRLTGPQQINPVLQDALGKLQSVFGMGDPGYGQFQQIANRRLAQLRNPLFSMGQESSGGHAAPQAQAAPQSLFEQMSQRMAAVQAGQPDPGIGGTGITTPTTTAPGGPMISPDAMRNSALLRSKFTEPLEQQRGASQRRALERASARGIGQGSGVLEQEAQAIDTGFDRMLSEGYRDLMLQEIQANEAREQEAVGIGQLLASLGNRDVGSKLSAAGQMANIGQGLQGEEVRNLLSAMGISQGMAQMPFQALAASQSALGSLGGSTVPQADPMTGMIAALLNMAQGGEQAAGNAQGQDAAFWQALMAALPGLIGSFQGGGGGSPAPGSGTGGGGYYVDGKYVGE
jgi:hypothetical protein